MSLWIRVSKNILILADKIGMEQAEYAKYERWLDNLPDGHFIHVRYAQGRFVRCEIIHSSSGAIRLIPYELVGESWEDVRGIYNRDFYHNQKSPLFSKIPSRDWIEPWRDLGTNVIYEWAGYGFHNEAIDPYKEMPMGIYHEIYQNEQQMAHADALKPIPNLKLASLNDVIVIGLPKETESFVPIPENFMKVKSRPWWQFFLKEKPMPDPLTQLKNWVSDNNLLIKDKEWLAEHWQLANQAMDSLRGMPGIGPSEEKGILELIRQRLNNRIATRYAEIISEEGLDVSQEKSFLTTQAEKLTAQLRNTRQALMGAHLRVLVHEVGMTPSVAEIGPAFAEAVKDVHPMPDAT